MTLKDIFTMIKADRYTADGCEEIKKAQKAIKEETADAGLPDGTMRHRKDGDYIKQAGKWVPAKRANGGAKKPEEAKPEGVKTYKVTDIKPSKEDGEDIMVVSGTDTKAMHGPTGAWQVMHNGKVVAENLDRVSAKREMLNAINSKTEESKPSESKPANTSWNDAKYGLVNKEGVPLDITSVTFSMTPAWARSHGFSPDDVNGHEAQRKTASKIIRNQDWSNPEEAVKKINEMDFGYNNWKVTEKQADKVKIEARDRLGNVRKLTIKRPEATPPASTVSKPAGQLEIEKELTERVKSDALKMSNTQIENRLKELESNLKAADSSKNETYKREVLAQMRPLQEEMNKRSTSESKPESAPARSSQSLEEFLHGNEPTPGSIMRDQQQKIMDANDNKVIIKRNHGMISLYGAKNGGHIADFQTEKERLDFMKKHNLSKPDSNSATPALIGGEKTIKRYKDLYDSAPRQLTGDCKVRIRKSK